jgi:dephospho-CoA kinase
MPHLRQNTPAHCHAGRVYWVGLTGGIGAGKSTVARLLAELGAVVVDADQLAREAVEPGTPGLAEIAETFGSTVIAADGSLDRAALASLVFADPEQLTRLNAIVHPQVHALTEQALAALPGDAIAVNDIPLLVEVAAAGRYDFVVVVDAEEPVRVARLVADRGMTEADARARIARQASPADRAAVADAEIDNNGSYDELVADVSELWRLITARAGR